ncbi:3-deoxy-manno-octulosonate cytidylyltransferase [Halalkalibacter alkaliphilus]|uniref:3-deoxy-manno-octulosonate cytidylyltransferase n=1 Tax=Halalkalibacter alkaliphilus TaxID=2917993 RepID=A0A9X2CTP2_9BACI|nr:3-deoxy-manno-octulosonate cytidylyltransferase [Halalkalibacter alkaliphilus]MCL7748036.1 3-deoxy-manno-octulosonate cytidylyltransferase [Halalkalibacter alkaliphilus]
MKVVGVIPARYGSTRFPGKPLALINGKPMIQHVYEQVTKSKELETVVVATDHEDIKRVVEEFGGKAIMTRTDHETGSDRISEVTGKVDGDFYVNVQGDEPLIRPELIDALVQAAKESPEAVVTAKTAIKNEEDVTNPNVVKVVTNKKGFALYFSRSAVPYNRSGLEHKHFKHLGLYGYPKEVLNQFVQLPPSDLEKVEVLEQLRLLENGYSLKVVETTYDAVGVDTPEDIEKVEMILGGNN